MKSGIFLSVREKATRIPGKVLKPLGGKQVTALFISRLKVSSRADRVVLTTSNDPRDNILCDIAVTEGISFFRGSADDKLLRYRNAARKFELDYLVVVDDDDPFVSIEHIDRIIEYNTNHTADLTTCGDLPLGATGFGLRRGALETICKDRPESNTETWGDMFLHDPQFNCVTLEEPNEDYRRPDIRMTLDYPEDYEFFTAITNHLTVSGEFIEFPAIMKFIKENPAVVKINQGAQEKYERHFLHSGTPQLSG